MVNAQIIEDTEQLFALRNKWNVLLEQSATGTVFQSPDWIGAWWNRFGADKKLFAVAVMNSTELVGLALFMTVARIQNGITVHTLNFVGETGSGICPDHLDILACPGFEEETNESVLYALFDSTRDWDMISLSSIAQDSSFYERMLLVLDKRKRRYESGKAYVAPFLALPSREHKNWKVKYRKLCKNFSVRMEYLTDEHDVKHGMAITAKLVGASAKRNNRPSSWDDEVYAGFHLDACRELARRKECNVAVLYCNAEPVAVLYGYVYKNKYLMYSTGANSDYGSYSVGQIIIGKFLEYLSENGIEEFDFLRGDEEYKFRWTETTRYNNYIIVYGNSIRGNCLFIANNLKSALRPLRKIMHKISYVKRGKS